MISPAEERSFSSPVLVRKASSHKLGAGFSGSRCDDDYSSATTDSAGSGSMKSSRYGRINVINEARSDLMELKKCMRRDNSRVLSRVGSIGPANIVENPTLGSIDQMRDDLRKDELEHWFRKHKKKNPSTLSMAEKRNLRKWFLKMDTDGSGEVGADELQDPLLSAGVVKSKKDIEMMLKTVEMNEDKEVTFDNFLKAVNNSKNCKKDKMKNLQVMSSDQFFSMETLLSQERRRMLLKGIVDDAKERQLKQEAALEGDGGYAKFTKRQREIMQRQHDDQVSDHNDFVNSLEIVLADKFRLMKHRREVISRGSNGRRKKDKLSAEFSFSESSDGADRHRQVAR